MLIWPAALCLGPPCPCSDRRGQGPKRAVDHARYTRGRMGKVVVVICITGVTSHWHGRKRLDLTAVVSISAAVCCLGADATTSTTMPSAAAGQVAGAGVRQEAPSRTLDSLTYYMVHACCSSVSSTLRTGCSFLDRPAAPPCPRHASIELAARPVIILV